MNLPPEFEWLVEQYCTKEESYGEDNIVKMSSAKIYSISRNSAIKCVIMLGYATMSNDELLS